MAKNPGQQMRELYTYKQTKKILSLPEKVGQLFMPAAFINDSEEEIRKLETLIKTCGIGGICFFHSRASAATNFEGHKKITYNKHSLETLRSLITRYQRASDIPLLISIDAEWGLAMRIENTPKFPYAITLGAIDEKDDLIFEVGRHIAADCKLSGIHWNFAPVVDINLNPANPVIGYRSFGADKQKVTRKAIAFMKGMQSEGILTAAKHFPGHGDTATDSHLGLPVIRKNKATLKENEFYPFEQMVKEGIDAIMVGHLAVPALTQGENVPATISASIIRDILRQDMQFKGVVVSDALNMHSVSKLFPEKGRLEWEAFKAGVDLLCFTEHVQEGIQQILEQATPEQIESSFERIWNLKRKALQNSVQQPMVKVDHKDLNRRLAGASLSMEHGTAADLARFRKHDFTILEIGPNPGQLFSNALKESGVISQVYWIMPETTTPPSMDAYGERILIALYPPSVKPPNNFGFSAEMIDFMNSMLTEKEVVLYLFGNPFVLPLLAYEKAKVAVLAYQDFESFQDHASRHFRGMEPARGISPVSLKT